MELSLSHPRSTAPRTDDRREGTLSLSGCAALSVLAHVALAWGWAAADDSGSMSLTDDSKLRFDSAVQFEVMEPDPRAEPPAPAEQPALSMASKQPRIFEPANPSTTNERSPDEDGSVAFREEPAVDPVDTGAAESTSIKPASAEPTSAEAPPTTAGVAVASSDVSLGPGHGQTGRVGGSHNARSSSQNGSTPGRSTVGRSIGRRGPPVDVRAMTRSYLRKVQKAIGRPRNLPRSVRRASAHGALQLAIRIDPRGRVMGVRVKRSSGHSGLDHAALDFVRAIRKVPPAPPALRWATREITLPMVYARR